MKKGAIVSLILLLMVFSGCGRKNEAAGATGEAETAGAAETTKTTEAAGATAAVGMTKTTGPAETTGAAASAAESVSAGAAESAKAAIEQPESKEAFPEASGNQAERSEAVSEAAPGAAGKRGEGSEAAPGAAGKRGEGSEAAPGEIVRQDGDRFEDVILLEGMEETVRYEHIRNEAVGIEMDYDYESFTRQSRQDCECILSAYDDPEHPDNYLEVIRSAETADAAAASVIETLSKDYKVSQEAYTLERAGNCIRIDASEAAGGGGMPYLLQMVYIIPASDGCRVATAHYTIESAEGFGHRFAYLMDTLTVIDREDDGTKGRTADGVQDSEAMGSSAERRITAEEAFEKVSSYCHSEYDWSVAKDNPSIMGLEMGDETESEYLVIFHSYTGAEVRFFVDKLTGKARMVEYVPMLNIENEVGTIDLFD